MQSEKESGHGAMEEFRIGGYGIQIARALARSVNCRWSEGRVVVRAEFV